MHNTSEELTDKDVELSKKPFNIKLRFIGKGLHKLIDEHKKTPASILKMMIEQPKRKVEVIQSLMITTLVIAFTFAIRYESFKVYPLFDIILAGLIIVMLIVVGYISAWWLIGIIEMEDEKWLVLKLMIALKEDDEKIKDDVRVFLHS